MRPISAADAIAPAVQRMRNLLFRPFRFLTFMKLCLVAVVTEGSSANFNSSWPGKGNSGASVPSALHISWSPDVIALIAGVVVGVLLLGLLLTYLIVRLRFALFYCLVSGTTRIKPGWSFYREQAGRFFWLSIVVGMVFLAVIAAIAVPFVFGFIRIFKESQGKQFDVAGFLAVFLPLIPIFLLIILAAIAVTIILRDLMLPHIALENATAAEAWRAARLAIGREKGSFFLYALLRTLLPVAVLFGAFLALAIPAIVVGVVIVLMAKTMLMLSIALGIAGLAVAVVAGLGIGGMLGISIRYYALIFYGSRYPLLGGLLWPAPPAPEPPPLPVA